MLVVIYTPTISAGISFNCLDEHKGFHKLYAYLKTGRGVASFNTHCQMLFRIRQLIDGEYRILFDRSNSNSYDFEENEIENMLFNKTERLFNCAGGIGNDYVIHPLPGVDADTGYKPKYDISHWSYKLWKQVTIQKVKYSKPWNFKEGLRQLFSNKASDVVPGRGMEWIDETQNQQEIELDGVKKLVDFSKAKENVIELKYNQRIEEKLMMKL